MTLEATTQERPLTHFPRCYGCGAMNDSGLRLEIRWDGNQAIADHVPGDQAEGSPGLVHGGYLGAITDEVMALAASEARGFPAATKRIELNFKAPVLTGKPLHIRSWAEQVGERRIRTRLIAEQQGRTCFEAEGTFVVIPMEKWIRPTQQQGRGPESVDWSGGDPSTFFRWQMRGGLSVVFRPELALRDVMIGLSIEDVTPSAWTIQAGPEGVLTEEGSPVDPEVRFTGGFREWQTLIHHTASLDSLLAAGKATVEGDQQALIEFIAAVDFERFASDG